MKPAIGLILFAVNLIGQSVSRAEEREKYFDPEDRDSIAAYLEAITPPSKEEIDDIIDKLSSTNFAERQKALRALARAAEPMREYLEKVRAKSDNAEVSKSIGMALTSKVKEASSGHMTEVAESVLQNGHRGLAAELIGAIPRLKEENRSGRMRILTAARMSADEKDKDGVIALLGRGKASVREVAARTLAVFEGDHREDVRPLLKDGDPSVRMAAAEIFADAADGAVLPVLAELATGEDFHIRWMASERLRQLTGGVISVDPLHPPESVDLDDWDKSKDLAPVGKLKPITLLRDGSELENWQQAPRSLYDEVDLKLGDDFVGVRGAGHCMFSQGMRFQNYRLRVEWRFSGGAQHPDAGIFLAKFADKKADKYAGWERGAGAIQVQIKYGSVGMFLSHGAAMAGGRMFHQQEAPYPSPENRDGWNQLSIEERDGKLQVWLNGVRVNSANGLDSNTLTTIGLSCEGYAIDFRNVTLEPLPGARMGKEPE